MTQAQAHEIKRLQHIIDQHERELDHRADVISTLADRLAETRAELDEAMRCGTAFATALSWAMPSHPLAQPEARA